MLEEEGENDVQEKSEEHEPETEMKALQLSLRISGLPSMKSIKMWGMVGDKQVAVPIGCGGITQLHIFLAG